MSQRAWGASAAPPLAVVGGILWALYGALTMLQPWGRDVVYSDARGYSVIANAPLFVAYNLPGALALLLTAGAVVVARRREQRSGVATASAGLAYLALVLGVAALVGVAVAVDPVFTAARVVGTLSLGAALIVAGASSRRFEHVLLGLLGLLLLPLWPLVHALGWVSAEVGAAVIVLFGAGWVLMAATHRLPALR